jgi:hypothetical protein
MVMRVGMELVSCGILLGLLDCFVLSWRNWLQLVVCHDLRKKIRTMVR